MLSRKKLALYIRLSSEDIDLTSSEKAESYSVSNQRKLLLDHYNSHSDLGQYELVEFCDDGFTGTNFERPQFEKMMLLVRQKEIHAIMVKDLSRFGRDYLEVGAYLELILPLLGTRFISVNDQFDSNDYIGTTGGIELALRNLINSLYSKDLSVKIRSANRTRNRRGEYWGGSAFYGYILDPKDKHKLLIDSEVVDIVRRIFRECIAGSSASQIAKRLNDDGIPSPVRYKRQQGGFYNGRVVDSSIWTAATILRILDDERYTGKMISHTREAVGVNTGKMKALPQEEWIIVDGTHAPIVSQSVFDEAKAGRKSRIKTVNRNTLGNRADNLFVCGYCGRKLQRTSGSVKYLFCLKARFSSEGLCSTIHVPAEELQKNVLTTINVLAQILIDRVSEIKANATPEIPEIQKKIAKADTSLKRMQSEKLDLYEEYRQGKISKDKFIAIQKKRQSESDRTIELRAKLEDQLKMLQKEADELAQLEQGAKDAALLSAYRPDVIRKLVNQVRVYEDKRIEIDFTFNNDFLLHSLEEALQKIG